MLTWLLQQSSAHSHTVSRHWHKKKKKKLESSLAYLGSGLAIPLHKLQHYFSSDRTGFKECSPQLSRLSICPAWRQEGVMRLTAV